MKKICLLLFLSLLCGCSGNSNLISSNNSLQENNIVFSDSDSNSQSSEALYIDTGENIYKDGLIYNNSNDVKMYLDFESMESTILCSKPNCTHQNSECIASLVGDTPIIYNNYIYYFSVNDGVNETINGKEFYINSTLKRVSLASSEIEDVVEFHDCEPREYDGCVIFDEILYFCGDNMNPTEDEYGDISYANGGGIHYFCSVNLNTGKYTNYGSIYDEDKQYEGAAYSSTAHVTGYYNNKIYIQYSFMKEYNDNTDIDVRDRFTILNFEYDLDNKKITESSLPTGSHMGDNFYVCSNYPESSSTVIVDEKNYIVNGTDAKFIGKYFNGKLFILDKWYNISDETEHNFGDYESWSVKTVYNDCYILANEMNNKFEKITEEELLNLN